MKSYKGIIYGFLYMVASMLLISSNLEERSNLCNCLNIVTELKNWKSSKGKKIYVKSGKWDEYDENGSINPMPDSLDVILNIDILSYYLKHSFKIDDERIDDFELSIEVQLKTGTSTNCTNVVNPKTSDRHILIKKHLVKYEDFFIKGKYKPYKIKTCFKIKEILRRIVNDDKAMLAQIIITTKINAVHEQDNCSIEYILATCQ